MKKLLYALLLSALLAGCGGPSLHPAADVADQMEQHNWDGAKVTNVSCANVYRRRGGKRVRVTNRYVCRGHFEATESFVKKQLKEGGITGSPAEIKEAAAALSENKTWDVKTDGTNFEATPR